MKLMRKALLAVIALTLAGCAVDSGDRTEDDLVRASEAALSSSPSPKKEYWTLYANATYDATTEITTVNLDTRNPASDPRILEDRFVAITVYRERGTGAREAIAILRGEEIGPGGGCIHFRVNAHAGDRLLIGAVVKLAGIEGATIAVVPGGTIVEPSP